MFLGMPPARADDTRLSVDHDNTQGGQETSTASIHRTEATPAGDSKADASELEPAASKNTDTPDSMDDGQAFKDPPSHTNRGPYSNGEIYGAAVVGLGIGFGAGHLIQGRYAEKGWIATVGGLAGTLIMVKSEPNADASSLLMGLAIAVGVRI